jgi:hypothetical protein
MAKKCRPDLHAVLEGDPLHVILGFFSRANMLRYVSKAFALHAPCVVNVSDTRVFPPRVPSRVTSLICKHRDCELLPLLNPGIARLGRDLIRLDLRETLFASFDFLGVCWVLKELYLQGSAVQSSGLIHSESLVVLNMFDTDFELGRVPKLQELTMQECPVNRVLPPSLTSLNCSYTHTPLSFGGLMLTRLDISGKTLPSLDFLGLMPLKELFLTSCRTNKSWQPWPLDGALLPWCVKLSISHTTIRPEGTFERLKVFDMQECPSVQRVLDAPLLTTLNCADNDLSVDFIDDLKRGMLTELNAAGCNQEIDLSGLVDLEYLAVPDILLQGDPPLYGFPPNLRVVRFSEEDLDDIETRLRGLPEHTQVYIRGFDVLDYEDPEESGLEGAWKSITTYTLDFLREYKAC